jgi:hypothetical protein
MATEQYSNSPVETTLTGGITAAATSMTLTSVTGWPTVPQFRAVLTEGTNSEIVLVTAVAGSTYTITRAVEAIGGSQVGIAFTTAAKVNHVLTVASLKLIGENPEILVAAATAPDSVKTVADYICDGTADQVEINQAIVAANAAGGGHVRLSQGTFNCAGAVKLLRRVQLYGLGISVTTLKAIGTWAAYDATAQGALVELTDTGTDRTALGFMTLWGDRGTAGTDTGGVYFNVTSNASFVEGTDSFHRLTDLYVYETKRHAIWMNGVNNRANYFSRIRVFSCGTSGTTVANGFYDQGNDSFYDQCEAGAVTGSGFEITAANNRFTNCKAWFAKLSGFHINAPRNEFAGCESQDNTQHGYLIETGPTVLAACTADSNSYDGSPSGAMTGNNAYDGFYVNGAAYVSMAGCNSFDKNESSRGLRQRYGFNFFFSIDTNLVGHAYQNVTGSIANHTGAGNYVNLTGATRLLTEIEQIPISRSGALTVATGVFRMYLDAAYVVESVRASVNTAPTGASLIVDVNKNGTTIYTTQANRPTITAASNTATSNSPDVTTFAAGDYITVDVDQIGSTVAGSDLVVTLRLRRV